MEAGEGILEKFYIPRRYFVRETELVVVKWKERNFLNRVSYFRGSSSDSL